MVTTDEEQRAASTPAATTWPLNGGSDGGGPLVPADGGQAPAPQEDDLDEPMTLQDHLKELRDRLIRSVIGIAIGMIGGFFAANYVLRFFSSQIKSADEAARLIQTSPTEYIVVYFKIAFYVGIALAMPILVYQFIRFLAPGLTKTEKRYVYATLPFVMLFFALGVAFASGIAIPNMIRFLLELAAAGGIANEIRVEEILGLFLNLSLWTGVTFQMPVIMFLLATLNIVPYQTLRKKRKYAAVGLMILAAVITPTPDALSMLIVWAPMYILFELGLIAARFARPLRRAEAA